jgi:hypothetical protein
MIVIYLRKGIDLKVTIYKRKKERYNGDYKGCKSKKD